jgi:hypothetical protein
VSVLTPYTGDTDYLFLVPGAGSLAPRAMPAPGREMF